MKPTHQPPTTNPRPPSPINPTHQPTPIPHQSDSPTPPTPIPHQPHQVKKVGAVSLAVALTGIVLVAGLPVVAHAASASLADLATGASSSYNSVMAKLAASGFLQAFSLVFVSEIGDKTFFIAGAWLDLVWVRVYCIGSGGMHVERDT